LSFTQSLREQGFIISDLSVSEEKAEESVEESVDEPKEEVAEEKPSKTPTSEPALEGLSFTQSLREQGLIVSDLTSDVVSEESVEAVSEDKEPAEPEKVVVEDKTESEETSKGEAKTFIDLIREEGLL